MIINLSSFFIDIRVRIFFLALLFMIPITLISAQGNENFSPPDEPIRIKAVRAKEKITIDGDLNEAVWHSAVPISDFFRIEPRQGGEIKYGTVVRILYDDDNIYVGFECRDSMINTGVRVQDLRRDFMWGENDLVGIALDPQNLKQYAQVFQSTPYGNQRDFQNFNGFTFDLGWNTLWSVRSMINADGYSVEMAIPFKSLRYDKPTDHSAQWGFTLVRFARREGEVSTFPAIPQSLTPYRMTYAALLYGLEVPKPSVNLRIEPYMAGFADQSTVNGEVPASTQRAAIGGEIKYAFNPRSVLDVTINTDFAQAEVDRAVNNLERFNILFPEQRQFFLENSGIWAGSDSRFVIPFFSRSIGLQGNFDALPAIINAGLRYTSRDESKAIAGLMVHQAAGESTPEALFSSARFLKNYDKENNVGIMFTNKYNIRSDALNQEGYSNTTLTVDGLVRPTDELTMSYLITGSKNSNEDQIGVAGKIFIGQQMNKYYIGWLTQFVSRDYKPEMGFVAQNNVMWHSPGGYYVWRPKKIPWIRRFDPGIFGNFYHNFNEPGRFQQANIYIFPVYIVFTNGAFLEYNIRPTWQNINFNFKPLGINIDRGEYFYTRQEIKFNTDESAKYSANGLLSWGDYYNGSLTTIRGGLRVAPTVYTSLIMEYELNKLQGVGVNKEDLNVHLASAGLRLALNPRVQFSSFYQYNTLSSSGRWNMRFSWEYRPLSFIYVVFNSNNSHSLDAPFNDTQLISKITFLNQF